MTLLLNLIRFIVFIKYFGKQFILYEIDSSNIVKMCVEKKN